MEIRIHNHRDFQSAKNTFIHPQDIEKTHMFPSRIIPLMTCTKYSHIDSYTSSVKIRLIYQTRQR